MKISLFYLFIVALIFTSCKEVHDGAHKEEQKEESLIKKETMNVVNNKKVDTSCFSDNRVFPETLWLWSQSWTSYYNLETSNPSDHKKTSPDFYFTHDSLVKLQKINSGASGVILYYILKKEVKKDSKKEKREIPSLAMINTINCKVADNSSAIDKKIVLVRWNKGKEEFITTDTLEHYKNLWKKSDRLRADTIPGYTPVNGYNYSWKIINSISIPKGGLHVKYGVRTLGPDELQQFTDTILKAPDGKEQIGNAVFCNVLVGWDGTQRSDGSESDFQKAIHALEDGAEELDFAKPCPTFCGEQ